MAKTRRQVLRSTTAATTTKRVDCEDKPTPEKSTRRTNKTSKSKSKITKKNNTTKANLIELQIAEVNSATNDDNEPDSSLPLTTLRRSVVTIEQITKLIGYVVNDNMSVKAASRKVRMGYTTAYSYYQEYEDDPEHKIPLPHSSSQTTKVTQEKIEALINYIINDKMNLTRAANKAKLNRITAVKYYKQYQEDPDHKIPRLDIPSGGLRKTYTQDQINDFIIDTVDNDKSVVAAAKKANLHLEAAKKYYFKFLEHPKHEIPTPGNCKQGGNKSCTNDEVKTLIDCIVNDEMTLLEASVKANMGAATASRYYRQYLDDPDHKIPTPEDNNKRGANKLPALDKIERFFSYVIVDKQNIKQASQKANISEASGYKYYKKYLKGQQHGVHMIKGKQYTREDIKRLIGYIENDKMSIPSAARKMNMSSPTARKYYKAYLKDPERKIPLPIPVGHTLKIKIFDQYSQIVAEIYKNNPSIKPIYDSHNSDLVSPNTSI